MSFIFDFLKYKLYKQLKSLRQKRMAKPRTVRFWIRDHLKNNARRKFGHYFTLILPAKTRDREYFYKMMRMSPESFNELTVLVRPYIERCIVSRDPVTVEERLAITIR